MDIVTTSLDALLHRATNPNNRNVDVPAVEAFCALINKEKDGPHIAIKLIAARMHSSHENEALLTLDVLDTCMMRCGNSFQAEAGKFRFLNEMIKLVSPKYLGNKTPITVRQKVLQLMYVWTLDYPKETKIKDAYDMLRKQGVIKEVPSQSLSGDGTLTPHKPVSSIFQDEEKSKLLQYLLRSKNPEDLQAANRLIKSMVKEDDKRCELKSKRTTELESAHNNIKLLNEMLDSYRPGLSSKDEIDLIKELHQSCERLQPKLVKMASETYPTEELLNNVIQINEELNVVLEKYKQVIFQCETRNNISLLDLESADDLSAVTDGILAKMENYVDNSKAQESQVDILSEIFNATSSDILVPMATNLIEGNVISSRKINCSTSEGGCKNKSKALEELDQLSQNLLKENLQLDSKNLQHSKMTEKIPMNLLPKQTRSSSNNPILNIDLNYLIDKSKDGRLDSNVEQNSATTLLTQVNNEDALLSSEIDSRSKDDEEMLESEATTQGCNFLKLSDLSVTLAEIKPSNIPPLTVLHESNGIGLTLHFAKEQLRRHVFVMVITTVSKKELPLSNYLFQAVVPKGCKMKLQPPSSTELPAYNPFLPPAAITQIMLIANPDELDVYLKFIVSYVVDNETITEMGEVEKLPLN